MGIKRIIYMMVIAFGVIGIIDTCVLAHFAAPNNLGIWLSAGVGFILVWLGKRKLSGKAVFKNRIAARAAKGVLIVWLCSFVLVEAYIMWPLGSSESFKADYIVILGAAVRTEHLSSVLKERVETALVYLRNNPGVKVVVSGGQGPDEIMAEATAMKRYLVDNQIALERIIIEDKSTSTLENLRFTAQQLPTGQNKIIIVTSGFHMRRALMLAERTGFVAYGLPSKMPAGIVLNSYLREYFAFVKSYLFDR